MTLPSSVRTGRGMGRSVSLVGTGRRGSSFSSFPRRELTAVSTRKGSHGPRRRLRGGDGARARAGGGRGRPKACAVTCVTSCFGMLHVHDHVCARCVHRSCRFAVSFRETSCRACVSSRNTLSDRNLFSRPLLSSGKPVAPASGYFPRGSGGRHAPALHLHHYPHKHAIHYVQRRLRSHRQHRQVQK